MNRQAAYSHWCLNCCTDFLSERQELTESTKSFAVILNKKANNTCKKSTRWLQIRGRFNRNIYKRCTGTGLKDGDVHTDWKVLMKKNINFTICFVKANRIVHDEMTVYCRRLNFTHISKCIKQ